MGTNNFLVDAFKDTGRYTIDTEEGADDTVTFVLTIKGIVQWWISSYSWCKI